MRCETPDKDAVVRTRLWNPNAKGLEEKRIGRFNLLVVEGRGVLPR